MAEKDKEAQAAERAQERDLKAQEKANIEAREEARPADMANMDAQRAARLRETAGVVDAIDPVTGDPIAGDVALPEDDGGRSRMLHCPRPGCTERCEVYEGDNPHKVNTMACPVHGRLPVKKA